MDNETISSTRFVDKPHNPKGIGYEKLSRGYHGRWMRPIITEKKQEFDKDGATIGCLTGIIIALICGLVWLMYTCTQVSYPVR